MAHFDSYGWYTSVQTDGRETETAPQNTSESVTPGDLRANWTGYEWVDLPYADPVVDPDPVPIPQTVSPRQFRQQLNALGMYAIVQAAVASADTETQIWWEYATEIERSNGPLNAMASALGVTQEALDSIFVGAAKL